MDINLIREGLCPHGHGPLDRRDDHGWCEECACGFSIDPKTVTLVLAPDTTGLDRALKRVAQQARRARGGGEGR